jgi:zinc and cadmium transporter
VGGVLAFFVIEKVLHWHHHQGIEDIEHADKPVGKLILISDSFHNFIDGLIIGASYLVSVEVGIATTIAVILHEIPQEIGDFGVLIHAGYSRAKALWYNFLSALFAVAGAIIALIVGSSLEGLMLWMVPIAAGGFIYIALSDLIPELHGQSDKSVRHGALQFFWILIGVLLMVLLIGVESDSHAHGDDHADEIHVEELHDDDEHHDEPHVEDEH